MCASYFGTLYIGIFQQQPVFYNHKMGDFVLLFYGTFIILDPCENFEILICLLWRYVDIVLQIYIQVHIQPCHKSVRRCDMYTSCLECWSNLKSLQQPSPLEGQFINNLKRVSSDYFPWNCISFQWFIVFLTTSRYILPIFN